MDQFTYLGSNISSTESDFNIRFANVWYAIDSLSMIWKSDLSDKIKSDLFQVVVVSILLYRCTTRTPTKCTEKKPKWEFHQNVACCLEQILEATPHKITAHETTSVLPLTFHLTNTQVSRTSRAVHYWRSKRRSLMDFYTSIFSNPSTRAGYDTRSIFKRSLTGLNSEFSFS